MKTSGRGVGFRLIWQRYRDATVNPPCALHISQTLAPQQSCVVCLGCGRRYRALTPQWRCATAWRSRQPTPLLHRPRFGSWPRRSIFGSADPAQRLFTLTLVAASLSPQAGLAVGVGWRACTGSPRALGRACAVAADRDAGRLARGAGAAYCRTPLVRARLAPAALSTPSTVPAAHASMDVRNRLAPCLAMAFGSLLLWPEKVAGTMAGGHTSVIGPFSKPIAVK
jgi:hypothetical protein